MYSNIIIPIDFSHAERFPGMFETAKSISANAKAQITLLHVVGDIPAFVYAQIPPSLHQSQLDDSEKQLHSLVEKFGLKDNVKVLVKEGHVSNTILKEANDSQADAIVIGSHKPGPTDYLIGSVAGRVVRHANCSVIVVR